MAGENVKALGARAPVKLKGGVNDGKNYRSVSYELCQCQINATLPICGYLLSSITRVYIFAYKVPKCKFL